MADTLLEDDYTGTLNLRLWGSTLKYLRPYWKTIVPLLIATTALAVLDGGFQMIFMGLVDAAVAKNASRLWLLGGGLLGLVLALSVSVWVYVALAGRVSNSVSHDIRRDVFARLQELEFAYYDRRPVGWLISRATSDCNKISRLLSWGLMDFIWGIIMMIVLATIMLVLSWRVALIVFCVVPPLVLVSAKVQKRMLASSRLMRKTNSLITGAYNESIAAVRTTKTLVREDESLREFQELSGQMFEYSYRNALQSAVYYPLVAAVGATGAGLAIWFGGLNAMHDTFSLGKMILFINCASAFFGPVGEMARVMTDVYANQASVERVLALLATEPAIKDAPEVVQAIQKHNGQARAASTAEDGGPRKIETIEFRKVGFAYKQGQTVLDNFNLTVKAGQTIALVGHTGGGKSTVVSLLCRFYEPTSGEILLSGTDYRKRSLGWLQSNLGIVLQSPHLFSGTVNENIRYGRLEATDEEVAAAARLVNAEPFILQMEKGYNSPVGQAGNRLSLGQKQLISFARAVLADPQIFVMDEATSSVDTQTERDIQRGVERLLKGRTSFVIAHRLSTIRSADRILVIDHGKIVEQGSHHELILHRGRYFELYTNQFTQEKEEQILATAK